VPQDFVQAHMWFNLTPRIEIIVKPSLN
jgi:hypothetical protein